MNWLITGGCGFLGTSLIKRLVMEGGHRIRVVDNLSVGTCDDLAAVCEFTEINSESLGDKSSAMVELIVGDILDEQLALAAAKGMDIIVHFAANTGVGPSVEDPRMDCVTNVIGTFNYLEAARHNKVSRFIFASSGAPAGEVKPPIHEELPPHPVSPYGASKLAGEGYCSAFYRTFGIKTIALRFGNVYGPLSKHKNSVVAKFFKQALNGEPLEIYGDGSQTRDFIYIDDLIQAVLLSAQVDIGGEAFQIATHKETTVGEIAKSIKKLVETRTGKEVAISFGETRLGDVKRNYSDISKARRMLKFEPAFDLEKGLQETLLYYNASVDPR
ncbi:MAG: NAD-dependent epimerase/dehydratase family protein [Desulfobulbaceae bacterium]|nr:NAD-dependent epimerase/dehydratase family protein [Desulfobulbaceae bacterium]